MIDLDTIGVIYAPTGETNLVTMPEGGTMSVAVMAPLPGWHVNITTAGLAVRPDLEPYVVTPSRLRQEWSRNRDDPQITVALRFADDAEALAVLSGPA